MKELIICLDLSMRLPVIKAVRERCEKNKCLLCDLPQRARGLCRCHYNAFMYRMSRLTRKHRIEAEVSLVKSGKVLPAYDRSMRKPRDVFDEAARRTS